MPKKRETLVLLDTHAIIHRAYHALPSFTSPEGKPSGAVYGLMSMIIKLVKDLKPDHIVAAYDLPQPTHRHAVYAAYKGTRPKTDPELSVQIDASREALSALNIPIYEAPGFEADDIIGTIAETAKKRFDVIIASGDMDTMQLVDGTRVRVYTLRKGIADTVLYDEDAVRARFGFGPEHIPDFKGIAGDTSDNIIGIPGIGEKGATELIKAFGSIAELYKTLDRHPDAIVEKGLAPRLQKLVLEHRDEAEFSRVLASIRTDAPIAFAEPEESFTGAYDAAQAVAFAERYGFRSLVPRLATLVPQAEHVQAPAEPLSQEEDALLAECRVMTHVLSSEMTNPSVSDVLSVARAETITKAHRALSERVDAEGMRSVYETVERPLIPVIEAMNSYGVLIDARYLHELSAEYHAELDRRAEAIFHGAGESFNINSPKQLADILFVKLGLGGTKQKKTATGQLSTKESELIKLAEEHPIVAEILAYRELSKLLGTYIDAIPPLLDAHGRLHTTFSQTGTATGRLSSRDPNVQNIPTKTELGRRIREAFVAPRGSVLITSDYSQIELRLAAILSEDEKLMDIFARGEDVHAAVAAQVFNVEQSEVTKEMRRRAKVINFGILYGMGVTALRENLGTDRAEAQAFYTKYFDTFTGLAAYLERTRESARRLGYTTTLFGRKRHFPGLASTLPYVQAQAERMAINAPLQGTQADIIKIAMVRIHDLFNRSYPGAHIVLQIHDELMFEVPESLCDEIVARTTDIMEHVLSPQETKGVPILVHSQIGKNWGAMTDV
ncbi:hypothetical protein KGO06_02310 [Patescibacteria group bacterium]|nr:hypothetical protein [Patescibacteria group bacterium]